MKKLTLAFSSLEMMAEFILNQKLVSIDINPVYCTITGELTEENVSIALNEYSATMSEAPDFIIHE
jgi:hypothetical protein